MNTAVEYYVLPSKSFQAWAFPPQTTALVTATRLIARGTCDVDGGGLPYALLTNHFLCRLATPGSI